MQHFSLKVIQIGNSLGITFPKEALAVLNAEKGDTIIMTPAPDGVRLSTYDAAQSAQLEAARKVMKKRRHALRELAK
jgi:putative addiction module antidote